MSEEARRVLTREFKLAALQRMLSGENVSALARDLGIKRKLLYQWRDRFRAGGPQALRSRGRPRRELAEPVVVPEGLALPAEVASRGADPPPGGPARAVSPVGAIDELAAAQARIAELERKIGRQELELDFFQKALRHLKDVRRPSDGSGVTTSTRSSRT
jgi:transposase